MRGAAPAQRSLASPVLLGGFAVYLWLQGRQMHHAYGIAIACHPASSGACVNEINDFTSTYNHTAWQLLPLLLQAVPALIGAFLGAPVLARELETGTFRYAWTQGFGRWRWDARQARVARSSRRGCR